MKNLLMTERWRPKNFDDLIILPRIQRLFENGLNSNYLFYGSFGTGKTTLARILIGKYTKKSPFIEINSSFHTSIDTLRNQVDEFCSKVYMGLDIEDDTEANSIKYVFLDEFDRTSIQYQDALKAYIEEYSSKNVRFILTTNHINKISPGVKSRCVEVNFDAQDVEEEKFLKRQIYKKLVDKILPKEEISISKDDLVKIINKNFPDFRSILISIDNFKLSGTLENGFQINEKLKISTFEIIFDKNNDYEKIFHFLMNNYGQDRISDLISILGKPLIDYSIKSNLELSKMFQANYIVCDYGNMLEKSSDPIILGMTIIGKLKELFNG